MERVKFVFAWYDLWIGFYWDRNKKHLYIMAFTIGVRISLRKAEEMICMSCYKTCNRIREVCVCPYCKCKTLITNMTVGGKRHDED